MCLVLYDTLNIAKHNPVYVTWLQNLELTILSVLGTQIVELAIKRLDVL